MDITASFTDLPWRLAFARYDWKSSHRLRPTVENLKKLAYAGYTRFHNTSTQGRKLSVNRSRSLQINLLPFAFDDSVSNLDSRLPFAIHGIRVIELFQASGALGAMGHLETAMQAVVAHPVAIAIARLLVEHGRNLSRKLVGMRLKSVLAICAPELLRTQDVRKLCSSSRWSRVVGWNWSLFRTRLLGKRAGARNHRKQQQ